MEAEGLSDEIDIHAPDAAPGVLLLPGRKFPLDFAGGELTIHGTPLLIQEVYNSGAGTGLTVWDGSVVLSKYLELTFRSLDGQQVVEVGSGTGIVGLTAALLGGRVWLTDLEYVLPNLRSQIARNAGALRGKGTAEAVELDWFAPQNSSVSAALGLAAEPAPTAAPAADAEVGAGAASSNNSTEALQPTTGYSPDCILGADVVWVPELIPALVNTLSWLSARPTRAQAAAAAGEDSAAAASKTIGPTIFIAHQTRSKASDALLFSLLKAGGFRVDRVPHPFHHPSARDDAIDILEITRRRSGASSSSSSSSGGSRGSSSSSSGGSSGSSS